jgi:hypothetical protein
MNIQFRKYFKYFRKILKIMVIANNLQGIVVPSMRTPKDIIELMLKMNFWEHEIVLVDRN